MCVPSCLRDSLSFVLVICFTSTASSITRFMNSSKPCETLSACFVSPEHEEVRGEGERTLIFPSILMESCSYNQTLTVEFCFRC